MDELTLEEYLNAKANDFGCRHVYEFVSMEPKTGIKRSNGTRTTEEGHLYRVGMNRLAQINPDKSINEVSILVDYDGLNNFPDSGMVRPGGEAKSAAIKRVTDFKIPELSQASKDKIGKDRRFKLYFATPTVFKHGWLPDKMDSETLIWKKNSFSLKLLTAAIGKPVMVGGWDIDKKQPKPMRKAVPAGSVYYLEILDGDVESIVNTFHYKNISDFSSQEGFGLSLVGAT
ncbi:MAG: hypothetical protein HRF42_12915 [Candidatus Brocadia sp.]|jgi:CRISPR-associated protein Cmr3